ncbi:importin-9 isoform X2 [Lepidochelys kempii]|uniref:importin-9 isoform X2 n=1 Tax=Lepidochelys kempii TaxID=8472 RepID=UPI003C7034EC
MGKAHLHQMNCSGDVSVSLWIMAAMTHRSMQGHVTRSHDTELHFGTCFFPQTQLGQRGSRLMKEAIKGSQWASLSPQLNTWKYLWNNKGLELGKCWSEAGKKETRPVYETSTNCLYYLTGIWRSFSRTDCRSPGSTGHSSEFTREVTDTQMPLVAPVILPEMYKIFTMAEVYGIRTRSRAVEIFTTCAHMICNMEELEKGAAKVLIFPVVQQFTEAFVQALQMPDGPTSDSGFKMEVLKAVTALVKNYPKHMVSSMQQILPIVWNTLTESAAFYVRTEVNYTEEVEDPVDSDGEVLGFENLVFSIFEFVHALLENHKFKSTVKKALPELIYYIILYMQITEEQIKVWTANPQQFVEDEDDDTFSYTVRIAAQDLLLAVAADFQNESATALAAAATRHLQEAEQAKNSGAEHWWKIHEACMLALGSVKSVITDSVKNGRIHFDMHGFLTNVVLADLNLSVSPFLLGRALWAASRFTVAMSPELIQQFLQATVSGLHETQPPSVRISAVRAIWGYCDQLKISESTHVLQPFLPSILDGLIHLAAQFSSEVLNLVMETLCIVCTVDPAFTANVENKICPFTIAIFLKYSNDPVVASLAQDIFKELAQIEACQGPMQMRLIPTLVSIMQAPADKIPAGLCATSIDILTTVVRNTKPPLSQLLICQAFPAVAQCSLHTDDNATMQNGGECLRAYVSVALEQIAQWHDEQGHNGLWYVMQVVSQLLDPRTSEFTAAFVGRLVSTLISKAGSELGENLDQILRAILSKMQQAETLSVMQSLIMVFAHLVHSQLEPLLEFLSSLPGPTGKPALEFVMAEWMSRQHLFYGQYEGKVSSVALCKLLQYGINSDDKRLQDIRVKGEEIFNMDEGIRTRSKSAKNPERWTNIPLLVKILKLIINELSNAMEANASRQTAADWNQVITGSSPSQRLVKLRKKKKRTRDEMFSELMLSSHTDRAQTDAWRQIMSECRKAQNDREERWRAEESKWRAEERAEAQMWRQRDERRQDSMLRLLEDQTSMLQCMVELQQRQLEHRLPLQPLCNQPPSSPSSITSTPRCPRTRWGGPPANQPLRHRGLPKKKKAGIQ